MPKKIALLGATGSIGGSTVDVITEHPAELEPVLFSGHKNTQALLALGKRFPLARLALSGVDEGAPARIAYTGEEGLLSAIGECGAHIAVNGIAGAAGLAPSVQAIKAGMDLALANKETIVMAGPLVQALAARHCSHIIPVDSEHAAVFNLIKAHGARNVKEIILTASGGPFRQKSLKEMAAVTAQEALAHPTWKMGAKITIDSATLANKGLEVIEAAALFHVSPDRIKVVIHPQSVVHAMVRMKDSAVYTQLSKPDMRLPIHEALFWPDTKPSSLLDQNAAPDFSSLRLEFEPPDMGRFPMLALAYEAARRGGRYPCAYNGANEAAVGAFIAGNIGFLDIPRVVEYVLEQDWSTPPDSFDAVYEADSRARELAEGKIAAA